MAEKSCKLTFEWEGDLNDLITLSFEGMVITQDLLIVEANQSFCELLGLPRQKIIKKKLTDFVEEAETLKQSYSANGQDRIDIRLKSSDALVYVACRHKKIGKFDAFVFKNTTDCVIKEQQFDEIQQRYNTIINSTSEGFWLLDQDRKILEANTALSKMLGYGPEEMIGKTPYDFVDDNNALLFHYQIQQIDSTDHRKYEIDLQKKDGALIPVSFSATTVRSEDGTFVFSFAFIKDITENKKLQRKLEELASTDGLTGAFNRLKLEQKLQEEISRTSRYREHPFSIILFDLDRFKSINDTHGHDVGDDVLKKTVEIVTKNIRNSDMFGRWGGEEFLAILPNTSLESAIKVARKLRSTIEKSTMPNELTVTSSFGVAEFENGDSMDMLVKRADTRLYNAKRGGRNRVVYKD